MAAGPAQLAADSGRAGGANTTSPAAGAGGPASAVAEGSAAAAGSMLNDALQGVSAGPAPSNSPDAATHPAAASGMVTATSRGAEHDAADANAATTVAAATPVAAGPASNSGAAEGAPSALQDSHPGKKSSRIRKPPQSFIKESAQELAAKPAKKVRPHAMRGLYCHARRILKAACVFYSRGCVRGVSDVVRLAARVHCARDQKVAQTNGVSLFGPAVGKVRTHS